MSRGGREDGGLNKGQVSKLRERKAEASVWRKEEEQDWEKKNKKREKNPREAKAVSSSGLINVTPFRVILMANVKDGTHGRLMFLNTHKALYDFPKTSGSRQ